MVSTMFRNECTGSVTILVVAITCGLLSVMFSIMLAVGSVIQFHKLQSTADLVALAGAQRVLDSPRIACFDAAKLATTSNTKIDSCVTDGQSITVTISQPVQNQLLSRVIPRMAVSAKAGF